MWWNMINFKYIPKYRVYSHVDCDQCEDDKNPKVEIDVNINEETVSIYLCEDCLMKMIASIDKFKKEE